MLENLLVSYEQINDDDDDDGMPSQCNQPLSVRDAPSISTFKRPRFCNDSIHVTAR